MRRKILLNQVVFEWRDALLKTLLSILMLTLTLTAVAQSVSGTISDENKSPMPGVSVLVKGTTSGTTTDANGKYSLEIPTTAESPILSISFIGYVTEEIAINNKSIIDLSLTPSIETLSEVVVVGYGTQKKGDVTGSIVSVSETALREVPVANLQQALQGRAAGLEIQRVGTTPGSGAQIRIRGERTILGSNDPLIVLDGIPFEGGTLNDINPDDVASIEVLKDASATAIYGSRGANGIILVTTKRGSNTGKTRLTVNSYYGVNSAARKYPVYNADEYRAMRDTSPWNQGYMPDELTSIKNNKSTNWQDLMYQKGYITDHNVTLAGGTESNQFSIGAGYFKETTVLPGQDFTRFTLRSTTDFKVGKKLKVGMNSLNNVSITNGSQFVNPMFNILALSPLMPAYDSTGKLVQSPTGNIDDRSGTYNPLMLKNNNNSWVDKVRRLRTFNSLYAEYQIVEGLKYRLNLGLDYRQQENDQFQGANSYFRPLRGNTASVNNAEGWGYTFENVLSYEKTFKEKHRVSVTGLYSNQQDHSHNTYIAKDSINEDFIQFYDLGQSKQSTTNLPTYNGSESSWALISYMARVNYAFDNRYMVTLTGRVDGSSRLAPGHKFHQYPAVSFGWNISNESFMQNISQITNLKLRAGYGETSNQSVSPYASLGSVSNTIFNNSSNTNLPVKYNYGNQIVGGYYTLAVPNTNLDWEYTRTENIGIDFGVLNNRITGSLDLYKANTHNVFFQRKLPASDGVPGSYNQNVGKIENKGIELTISSQNLKTASGFTWGTDLNIFLNRNKLEAAYSGFTMDIANGLYVGQPLSAIYDYKKLGIWQINEAAEAAKFGQLPGQLKIADLSGAEGKPDGKIDNSDKTFIGNGQAKWQGGITNRFTYKGIDFSFVIYARFGGTLISGVHQPTSSYLTVLDGKRNGIKVDYWTPTNPTNDFPAPSATINPPSASTAWTTLGYYDASFVKVRSINLGYTFSNALLQRLKTQALRVYVQAQNPFLLYSPYVKAGGVDPEATGTGVGTNGFVADPGNIPKRALTVGINTPPTRSFIVGLNITF